MLISVVFTTTADDVGDDHFINITAEKDFNLTSADDSISGDSFPLTGGPIEIIPEFEFLAVPVACTVLFFIFILRVSRPIGSKGKKKDRSGPKQEDGI